MIRYTLACDEGHDFESWFRDAAACDEQAERGLLTCPSCGSTKVGKAIMAPQVARKDRPPARPEAVPAPRAEGEQPVALVSPQEVELREKLRALRAHLTENAADVGKRFAEEARKMHFGETEHRSIYGEATPEDARSLIEDGVEFYPLPAVPDERN